MSDRRPSYKVRAVDATEPGHDGDSDASTHEHPVIDASKNAAAGFESSKLRRHSNTAYVNAKPSLRVQIGVALAIARRVVIFVAAILYLQTCLSACRDVIQVLQGRESPSMGFVPYESPTIAKFVGSTTLRASPLIMNVLQNDTAPRSGTMYLESETASFTPCKNVPLTDRTYGDAFQRWIHNTMAVGASFNLTFLDANVSQLIVPVVDCGSSSIVYGDKSAVRFYYLTRKTENLDDVDLLIVTMSIQEYMIPAQNEQGAAAISTIATIDDLRAQTVKHHFVLALGYPFAFSALEVYTLEGVTSKSLWRLKHVPSDPSAEYAKVLITACRTGFFASSENEQSNIRNSIWDLSDNPLTVISTWQWRGRVVLRDSWAWVHFIHLLLAFDVLVNLVVLLMVVYRNFRAGKLWIGDAFVAVSTTLWLRSSLVVISWWVSGFWSLMEFCYATGNVLADTQGYFFYPSIIRADLLALYFSFIGFIGNVLKERIDPALTIGLFYIGFEQRIAITKIFADLYARAAATSIIEFSLAMSDTDAELESISPLRFWSPHHVQKRDPAFVAALVFPVFSSFLIVVAYVAVRKAHRFYYPDKLMVQRVTGVSEDEEQLLKFKHDLTQFEVATGAALQNRYGVVADYNNCLYIRGVKYASADGIYSSGYVVANGKFLIQTDDLTSIVLMKLLRRRYRNIYVYEVDGAAVKQTARLVYPETISYKDLLALNVENLA
ncbi:hypothetical protein PybrP1_002664 [[Pythium] brassicae (nom. inval.)]|nr:hypothetical protein PybrP1_002664 [[Pythium] brassicae (nom. inval.)]